MNKHIQTIRSTLIASGLLMSCGVAQADPLQPNTLYATNSDGLYAIDDTTWTATKVGDANVGYTQIQDIAVSGNTLYGVTQLMQMYEYDEADSSMHSLNSPHSYSDKLYGLDQYQGTLYTAGHYGLATVVPENDEFHYIGNYGLGAGEEVTDLAFADDGTLYATVTFNINYGSQYLATIDTVTGAMNLIGNMYIYAARGLAYKNGTLYAIDSTGDLFSVNPVSGMGTLIKESVLPGVYGLTSTPVGLGGGTSANGEGEGEGEGDGNGDGDGASSGGALSLPMMLMFGLLLAFRKMQASTNR